MNQLFGGIEAGGTKFVCAVGSGPGDIRAETRFPTTTPNETIEKAVTFFKEFQRQEPLAAIGIASFGPVDLNPASDTYGYITATPKPNWSYAPFAGVIAAEIGVPVGFDTDVNGALLGEQRWGAAQGLSNAVYLTIGTGIGGGAMVNGQLVHGLVHPEMGHGLLPPRPDDPHPEGWCPFHGYCLEGMAAGPAIEYKWGIRAENLPSDHPAWDLEAYYLAKALHSFITTLSPERIIMGGGVMNQSHLFPLVRQKTLESLNGYVQHTAILEKIEDYIVPPGLGNQAGVLGAIALGMDNVK
jgi:fructokinase